MSIPRQLRRLLSTALIIVGTVGILPAAIADDGGISFADVSQDAGLKQWAGPAFRAGWVDMDFDGLADPVFVSMENFLYVVAKPEGGFETKVAEVISEHDPPFSASAGDKTPMVTGDFDRDGRMDIMFFAGEPRVYTIVAPGKIESQGIVASRVSSRTFAEDAASADLNLDGWPDVVVGVGLFANEHIYPTGAPDTIYMNRGGHFERIPLPVSRSAHTNSLALADIDRDGRVDIVESFDFSQAAGFSYVLFNRTEPGALNPVFEREPIPFDYGSFGMGLAIADVDGDGNLDLYNASGGRDFLLLRQSDGSYVDDTVPRGLFHEWGTSGARVQWAPTFRDLNGDGLMDLFVRHGHITQNSAGSLGLTGGAQMNLVYLQAADGSFERVSMAFDPTTENGGVGAVLGDVNGDGLPDLALDNIYSPFAGEPELWINQFQPPEGSRRLTVRLKATVSAHPPTGAEVEATCGNTTRRAQFTTGGKVGAAVATEVFLTWGDCSGPIAYSVKWPSGVVSQHTMEDEGLVATATEPLWYEVSAAADGTRTLAIAQDLLAGDVACFVATGGDSPECCTSDESCTFALPADLGSPGVVQVGEMGRGIRIDPPEGDVVLVTDPALPVPGEALSIRVGQGRTALPGLEPWVRVAGDKIAWSKMDEAMTSYRADLVTPFDEDLPVKVFVEGKTKFNESVPTGWMLDPRLDDLLVFPYEDVGSTKLWRVIMRPAPGVEEIDKEKLEVRLGNGSVLEAVKWTRGTFGRFFLEIPWEQLPEGTTVSVFEKDRLRVGPLPVFHAASLSDPGKLATSVRGFTSRPAMLEDGDNTRVYFSLMDANGYPLPPDPEAVTFETDGLVLAGDVSIANVMTWELTAMFVSTP